MATKKEPEQATEQPANIVVTADFLQQLLKGIADNNIEMVKTLVEEQKKPSAAELATIERNKRQARINEDTNKREKEARQARCPHARLGPNEDNKTTFVPFRNVFPAGAWTLLCQRCSKMIQNFRIEDIWGTGEVKAYLLSDDELDRNGFSKWFLQSGPEF